MTATDRAQQHAEQTCHWGHLDGCTYWPEHPHEWVVAVDTDTGLVRACLTHADRLPPWNSDEENP